ncbi:unnamed protein product [Cyprideis torosa]|uniref:Uncharacterized protein n=1 Tax=Cyprideis torosa TaxID=163714 RepID=A0A7R8W6Q3_9CRUS|nr:unnamed protein product [Cyprideis torosa]CAG0886785.1 unnamed protein product [Cyprideis torosa]
MHSMRILFDPEYGFVLVVTMLSVMFLLVMARIVGRQRGIFNVHPPKMHDEKYPEFNCYVRAHQNTVEFYPTFVVALLISGLGFPVSSAWLGIGWIVSRIAYFAGYVSGDVHNRMYGFIASVLCQALLAIGGMLFALSLTRVGYYPSPEAQG